MRLFGRPLTMRVMTPRGRSGGHLDHGEDSTAGARTRGGGRLCPHRSGVGDWLRSVAAPVRDASGRVVAALNVGVASSRADCDDLVARVLPALYTTAGRMRDIAELAT